LDRDQHHQRTQWPTRAHRGLGQQPNDRLGRIQRQQLFEHRREILRDLPGTYANTHSHCYADSYGYVHAYTNSHSYSHADAEPNSHTYWYAWRNGNCNANGDSVASITNPNRDTNSDTYCYAWRHGNCYGHGYGNIYTYAYTQRDAASPDAAA